MYKTFVGHGAYTEDASNLLGFLGAGSGQEHEDVKAEGVLTCALETLRKDCHAPIVSVSTVSFFANVRERLLLLGLSSVPMTEIFPRYLDGYLHTFLFYRSSDPDSHRTKREADMEAEAALCLYEYFKALWKAESDPSMKSVWGYFLSLFD